MPLSSENAENIRLLSQKKFTAIHLDHTPVHTSQKGHFSLVLAEKTSTKTRSSIGPNTRSLPDRTPTHDRTPRHKQREKIEKEERISSEEKEENTTQIW